MKAKKLNFVGPRLVKSPERVRFPGSACEELANQVGVSSSNLLEKIRRKLEKGFITYM